MGPGGPGGPWGPGGPGGPGRPCWTCRKFQVTLHNKGNPFEDVKD